MRLLTDGIWSRAQSLEFHSPDGGSQGLISTKFLGIHSFTKGLGIMFGSFVHANHKKSLVYLMRHFLLASIRNVTL